MGAQDVRGLVAKAAAKSDVDLVGVNEVKIIAFGAQASNRPTTLGVRYLSACSVIGVVSDLGAILAHVGPNIHGSADEDSGSFIRLAHIIMNTVQTLYQKHSSMFTESTNAYLIYAILDNNISSPEHVEIFRTRLGQMGLPLLKEFPYVPSPPATQGESRGTVWIKKEEGRPTTVYLEDKIITQGHNANTANQTSRSLAARGSSSQTKSSQASSSQASSSRASSSQASFSQASSSHNTSPQTSPPQVNPSQAAMERMFWTMIQGENEYKLVTERGQIVRRTTHAPQNVRIRIYNANKVFVATRVWNGSQWQYA